MPKKILLFLFSFLLNNCLFAQKDIKGTFSSKDFEEMYQKCTQIRLDSVHRLHIHFLRTYGMWQDYSKMCLFSEKFKEKCLQNNNKALFRRILITEKIEKLKHNKNASPEAEKQLNELYNDFLDEKDYSAALECLLELGLFHNHLKNDVQAMKVLFFAEKFAEKYDLLQDISLQGTLYRIGYILWDFDLPNLSTKYLQKTLKTTHTRYKDSIIILNAIGINYQKINELDKSMEYFEQATKLTQVRRDTIFRAVIAGNMAVTLYKQGNQDKAYEYAQQDKNISIMLNSWKNAIGALHSLIKIEIKRNNLKHAKILLDSLDNAILKADDQHFISQKRQKEAAFLYYEATNDYKKAFSAHKEFLTYDSLAKEFANKNKISELQLGAEVRLYEQEMNEKEQEKQIRNILFALVVIVLIILMFIVLRYFYKKNIKIQQEKKIIENKKKEVENLNAKQAQEIAVLKQELFSQLAHIKQSNTNFQAIISPKKDEKEDENFSIAENIDIIAFDIEMANINEDANENNNENTNIKEEDLKALRDFNLTRKDQWNVFKASFLKIYPDFETKITNQIGEVSEAELRLMMLHKLGLGTKEIAQMLLISPDSVKKGKHRLYKKIGISSTEELNNFL